MLEMVTTAFPFVSPIATWQRLPPWLADFNTKGLYKVSYPQAMVTTADLMPY